MAFDKILIANRGEIAVRIIRTARALGYRTVAVHSEADAETPHVQLADQAVAIGGNPVGESYLNVARLIAAARRAGADAVHPGYGFLSENAAFAAACGEAGLVFIGPPVEAIRLMGNKRQAKLRMQAAGVPVVPGYSGEAQGEAELLAEARRVGLPLMIKAAAGGGGRGMRLVEREAEIKAALASARSEAQHAFGSGELILEKAVREARHVEIQVFADGHGNVVHLGERDCSIQRRHQKVVEEAPSPAVSEELRAAMGEAAVAAARAVGYVGAGTVEFLLDADGRFYFLEMNTRLQVEHPVTEMIIGQDLVAWQIAVAAGGPLPLDQEGIRFTGHAIEARLYAEDPYDGFLPRTGRIAAWRPATGEGIRVDSGIAEGQDISPFYDPLLAKLIAHGATREDARRRLVRALADTVLLGIESNRAFLIDLLSHATFVEGAATTGFIGQRFPNASLSPPEPSRLAVALAALLFYERGATADGWRNTAAPAIRLDLRVGEATHRLRLTPLGPRHYAVAVADGDPLDLRIIEDRNGELRLVSDGLRETATYTFHDDRLHLQFRGRATRFAEEAPQAATKRRPHGDGRLLAPMAGRIVAVRALAGSPVKRGDILVVLEAMKMEHEIKATADGTVAEIAVREGEQVSARQLLAQLQQ